MNIYIEDDLLQVLKNCWTEIPKEVLAEAVSKANLSDEEIRAFLSLSDTDVGEDPHPLPVYASVPYDQGCMHETIPLLVILQFPGITVLTIPYCLLSIPLRNKKRAGFTYKVGSFYK